MRYFLALTNYHYFVYSNYFSEYKLIDLRSKGLVESLYLVCKVFFVKNKSVCLPHIFNLYCSLLYRFSKNIIIYDEGIAYYNNTVTPDFYRVRFYMMLAGSKLIKGYSLGKDGYFDFLEYMSVEIVYLFYPNAIEHGKIKKLKVLEIPVKNKKESNKEVLSKRYLNKERFFIFLDSHPDFVSKFDSGCIVNYLETISRDDTVRFLYKRHPSGISPLGKELLSRMKISEVHGSFEEYLLNNRIDRVYSLYSSASITSKIINEEIDVFYFKCYMGSYDVLEQLFSKLGVVQINDYCR